MPGPIKKEICTYFLKKSFGLKPSDHQTIWTSFFYFAVTNVHKIASERNLLVVTFAFHGKPLTVEIRGVNSSDVFVFFQVFIAEGYRPLMDFLRQKSIVPRVMIDVGANVGYFSLLMRATYDTELFVAVEPEEGNFQQLTKNSGPINGAGKRLMRAAIWSHKKMLSIHTDAGAEWAYRVGERSTDQLCEAFALSDIMEQHNISMIDVLKLDVEGTEDVLFRDRNFLDSLSFVKVVGLEIHDTLADRKMIHRELQKIGFKFFEIGELTIAWNTKLLHE